MAPEPYREAFALCSALLRYPDRDLLGTVDEIESRAGPLPGRVKEPLLEFLRYLRSSKEHDLQEAYVRTFDFDEANCLYLTYAGFGTRPERGLELLRLKLIYASEGMQPQSSELPDYLPLVLEFLSMASVEKARSLLEQNMATLVKLQKNLERAGSPYHLLLKACLSSAGSLVKGGAK